MNGEKGEWNRNRKYNKRNGRRNRKYRMWKKEGLKKMWRLKRRRVKSEKCDVGCEGRNRKCYG